MDGRADSDRAGRGRGAARPRRGGRSRRRTTSPTGSGRRSTWRPRPSACGRRRPGRRLRRGRRRPRRRRRPPRPPAPRHRHRARRLDAGDAPAPSGRAVVGAPVPQGKAGDQLLEKLGYRVRWTSWVLELLDGATVPSAPLPEGYAVREATPADYEAVWTVTEDAFLEWSDRDRQTFEDWQPTVPGRPGFEPWNIRVVTDPTGDVVAVANVHLNKDSEPIGAYIDRLATRTRPPPPRARPGPARRLVRGRPRARRRTLRAVHRLAHRRPRPLREGRDVGDLGLGQPGDRPLAAPARTCSSLRPCPAPASSPATTSGRPAHRPRSGASCSAGRSSRRRTPSRTASRR